VKDKERRQGPTHRSVTGGGSRSTLTLRWQETHSTIITPWCMVSRLQHQHQDTLYKGLCKISIKMVTTKGFVISASGYFLQSVPDLIMHSHQDTEASPPPKLISSWVHSFTRRTHRNEGRTHRGMYISPVPLKCFPWADPGNKISNTCDYTQGWDLLSSTATVLRFGEWRLSGSPCSQAPTKYSSCIMGTGYQGGFYTTYVLSTHGPYLRLLDVA